MTYNNSLTMDVLTNVQILATVFSRRGLTLVGSGIWCWSLTLRVDGTMTLMALTKSSSITTTCSVSRPNFWLVVYTWGYLLRSALRTASAQSPLRSAPLYPIVLSAKMSSNRVGIAGFHEQVWTCKISRRASRVGRSNRSSRSNRPRVEQIEAF